VSNHRQPPISPAEVEALYRRYGATVHRRACALLGGSEADASDAVQEVFIKVLGSYHEFRGESSPMTWLYRVTTNLCLNRLRDRRRQGELLQQAALELPPPGTLGPGRRLELTPDIRALLLEFPEQEALAGVYHHVDGMSHEEIAPLLEVSRRTVGNLLARFRERALRRLGPDDDAEVSR